MAQHLTIAILFLLMTSPFLLSGGQEAYAQSSLNVTASQPCFLNYTANGLEMMQQCGLDEDYLRATTVGFDWVTGGLMAIDSSYRINSNDLFEIPKRYLPTCHWYCIPTDCWGILPRPVYSVTQLLLVQ
jgi:hypothetical protein